MRKWEVATDAKSDVGACSDHMSIQMIAVCFSSADFPVRRLIFGATQSKSRLVELSGSLVIVYSGPVP